MLDLHEGAEIIVPGSIANLGPGLDTLALAVPLYLSLRVRKVDYTRPNKLVCDFGDHPPQGENKIETAFRFLASSDFHFPGMEIAIESTIPQKAGLGSSAAAIIAGLRLFELVTQPMSSLQLLTAAYQMEGHPENAAASLLGGLAVCRIGPLGEVHAVSLEWPRGLDLLVITPEHRLSTQQSREVLPQEISRHDAVSNIQNVSWLLAALTSGNVEMLRHAFRDHLHQPFRCAIVPGLEAALEVSDRNILGVFLSGSGPSIVAVTSDATSRVEELFLNIYDGSGIAYQIRRLAPIAPVARELVREPQRLSPPSALRSVLLPAIG